MNNKVAYTLILLFIVTITAVGIVLYPSFPANIASHWNVNGEADGYMQKFWGVFLLPMMMAGLFLFYLIIPTIDPYRANIETFRKQYNFLWVTIFGFFAYVSALTLAWNTGFRFDFTIFIIPAFAALWYALGHLLKQSKRNWFVGIRTPWTLSSDTVWEKTHRLGAVLFKTSAIISLFGLSIPDNGIRFLFVIIPVIAVSIVTIVYSYVVYRKENQ